MIKQTREKFKKERKAVEYLLTNHPELIQYILTARLKRSRLYIDGIARMISQSFLEMWLFDDSFDKSILVNIRAAKKKWDVHTQLEKVND